MPAGKGTLNTTGSEDGIELQLSVPVILSVVLLTVTTPLVIQQQLDGRHPDGDTYVPFQTGAAEY